MLRIGYGLGCAYLALCGLALAARSTPEAALPGAGDPRPTPGLASADSAAGWFERIRPRCNAVEVEVALRSQPAPAGDEGASYTAGCHALAGKIERARSTIDALAPAVRQRAAGIVFDIVHPVADAGDDQSAGPMMRLVLDYTPENFQALYHAGMSEYEVGDYPRARAHLQRFLELYRIEDGWNRNAREVLGRPQMKP